MSSATITAAEENESDLERQRAYARKMVASGFDFGLTVGDAFVRGIRDIGYKSTATALDEHIDNADQAGARIIHVAFGYGPQSAAKPEKIAVIDNGHGMDPDMIRLAALWGGTHRENDRTGFGRYGYGLPSSAVSQGERFTIYSLPAEGRWHAVALDLQEITAGKHTNSEGRIIVPEARPVDLPQWLQEYIGQHFPGGELVHGNVVELSKLDRLSWTTTKTLKEKLLEHFGITYRNFLRTVDIYVDGTQVQPTDPLFLTPGYRFYDLDSDRARGLPPLTLTVADDHGDKHTVKVRFAYLPPSFPRKDKSKGGGPGNTNKRFPIMKEHNGIIALRNGRQIDVISVGCPWTHFQNNDRFWNVEVDFPPGLDEEFQITTSKQRVIVSPRIWEILRENGVYNAIQQMRADYKKDSKAYEQELEEKAKERASEQAMAEAEKFKTRQPEGSDEERREREAEDFRQEVERRARLSGRKAEDVDRELRAEIAEGGYRVQFEDLPGAPYYRMLQLGGQTLLFVNREHRWFTDVYNGPGTNPRWRAALEVMLFVMGECELSAADQRRLFYQTERAEWSNRLTVALDRLEHVAPATEESPDEETGTEPEVTAAAGAA